MNEMSLSRLYRRLVTGRPQPALDAAELVDAGDISESRRDALAAKLASSTEYADLTRMLRALQPASQTLAEHLTAERRVAAHPARARDLRPAAGARRSQTRHLRWVGAMAACLAVALGLWSGHTDRQRGPAEVAATAKPAALGDRIFTTRDAIFASSGENAHHHQREAKRGGDELFHANFSG
ncbi:MAG: hypothetical protein ABI843_05025 [Dokdonella sp.]